MPFAIKDAYIQASFNGQLDLIVFLVGDRCVICQRVFYRTTTDSGEGLKRRSAIGCDLFERAIHLNDDYSGMGRLKNQAFPSNCNAPEAFGCQCHHAKLIGSAVFDMHQVDHH